VYIIVKYESAEYLLVWNPVPLEQSAALLQLSSPPLSLAAGTCAC